MMQACVIPSIAWTAATCARPVRLGESKKGYGRGVSELWRGRAHTRGMRHHSENLGNGPRFLERERRMTTTEPSRVLKRAACPKCGGPLRLFPLTERVRCDSCGHDSESRTVRGKEWRAEKERRRLEEMRRRLAE